MLDLYQNPRTVERFQEYITTLQGNTKGDLTIPISGYNPMAKAHISLKLNELKDLQAEQIISLLTLEFSFLRPDLDLKVALNLLDDTEGGWTNRFTSDYQGKFMINALVERNFCIPIFWASEDYTAQLIKIRVQEYLWRTAYWKDNGRVRSLEQHVAMERFVAGQTGETSKLTAKDREALQAYVDEHKDSPDYLVIFNFFYGSEAARSLNFPVYAELPPMGGFEFSK